jgi:hypothetical protein
LQQKRKQNGILIVEQMREAYEAELRRREKKAQIARAREEIQRRKVEQALSPYSE